MAAESVVDQDNPTENASRDTKEDVKDVLFQLKSILNGTDPSFISESTVSEPTIPTKSSSEILSELFSAFNAEPPNITDNVQDIEPHCPRPTLSPESSSLSETLNDITKVNKKRKASKKHKHKHKKHKHKKKIRQEDSDQFSSNSSSGRVSPSSLPDKRIKVEENISGLGLDVHSNISSIDVPLALRIKKEKAKSKHKTKSQSKHSRAASRSVKLKHMGLALAADSKVSRPKLLGLSIKITNDLTYDQDRILEFTPDVEIPPVRHDLHTEETNTSRLELEPPTCVGLDVSIAEYENIASKIKIEPGTESSDKRGSPPNNESCTAIGQAKSTGKISIKNLKFSSVFEATVREVEEQAKAKANKYEEGEISNSDCDDLVLSPISSPNELDEDRPVSSTNSFYNSTQKKAKKIKKRHHSESGDRSSKHHHSSKRRRDSKSESEHKFLDLPTSSYRLKCHDRKKKKSDKLKETVQKKKSKQSISPNKKKKHRVKSCLTSKSPGLRKSKINADKNALGTLSKPVALSNSVVNNRMIVSASGRKTVEELTNFCKRLSKKELSRNKNGIEEDEDYGSDSDSETEQPFNHPFQVKERPQSIVVNIRNSIQLPVKSLQEKAAEQSKQLRVQFPVSSGQRHRKAEDEWVPVAPKPAKGKKQPPPSDSSPKLTPAVNSVSGVVPAKDIGSIVTLKLRAMRMLQENPNDVEALGAMFRANQDMLHWAEEKQNQDPTAAGGSGLTVHGQTGIPQTMPTLITPNTSCSGRVGMGMSLLQKMGWKPGEGLGKNREGALEPLKLEIKMDKKGLITAEDLKVPPQHPIKSASRPTEQPSVSQCTPAVHNVAQKPNPGKHPISKLVEFCGRKRWRGPQFELCHESGPAHRKNFLFKVLVNGTEYKPMVTSLTKKLAKTEAASICLQALRDLN